MALDAPTEVADLARHARNVVVLTGAGMSAESGVPTFRDAQTGLWEQYDATALATPRAWNADPDLVWAWYQWRSALVRRAAPNAGHRALADWSRGADVRIVTQNVDDLHERAGSNVVAHLHGSLFAPRCDRCGQPFDQIDPPDEPAERTPPPRCDSCGGAARPGVVWFGEALPEEPWERALAAIANADLVVVVGTSGVVYPAAGLPSLAREAGVPTIEINPDVTDLTEQVDHIWRTTAARGLPILAACAN
ncbi:NAD-dependent deacylase [Antrihabitans sp. YC2-6]|uniref:SIR2 family NAD-dependent protein deacylase n=1 Tax=Antrihabitans sp. YC2-6 TaxID=2799498 RepID=UPI0018F5E425|nr:NAD-dependent deacylase [Antrihabitans sp. YC2-6]MBJ8348094.1 NAD-dependent deacylase [Antrihabitans sp. YC2-6]